MDAFFTEGSKFLVSQGILGLVVVALSWAYWHCRTQVSRIYEERLTDFRATLETIHANNKAISDITEATRARTDTAAAIAEAQKLMTAEHSRSNSEIERLRHIIADLEDQIAALREELVRRGAV